MRALRKAGAELWFLMWGGIWFQTLGEGRLPELSPCPHDKSCVGFYRAATNIDKN